MSIPKVAGIETEYGIMWLGHIDDPIKASNLVVSAQQYLDANKLPKRIVISSDRMLPNGSRFYVDHTHPEYSTPECMSPFTLVAADKAGECIAADSCRLLSKAGIIPSSEEIILFKNNSDHKGNSYGCHENYLLAAPFYEKLLYKVPEEIHRLLIPFFISRIIYCGSGKVGGENGSPYTGFQLSQRADFFEALIGLQTTSKRPIFNTRDEPHSNPEYYRRLHVICGDANMAELSTILKVGVTQIFLRMLEDDFISDDFRLEDPLASVRTVSRDMNFHAPIGLANGKETSALAIQKRLYQLACDYLVDHPDNREGQKVLKLWGEVLELLEEDGKELSSFLDWAIKKSLFDEILSIKKISLNEVSMWGPWIEIWNEPLQRMNMGDRKKPLLEWLNKQKTKFPDLLIDQIGRDALTWEKLLQQQEVYYALNRLDFDYHRLDATGQEPVGLYNRLVMNGIIQTFINKKAVKKLIHSAPKETRAWFRGRCLTKMSAEIERADWSYIYFKEGNTLFENGQKGRLDLSDPFLAPRLIRGYSSSLPDQQDAFLKLILSD